MALSLPALIVTMVDGADRWLQQAGRRYRKAFCIVVAIVLILFGATEFWLSVAFTRLRKQDYVGITRYRYSNSYVVESNLL